MRIRKNTRAGLSLIEVLSAAALGTMLLGSGISLFSLVARRVALDGSDAAVSAQANQLMAEICQLVRTSRSLSVSSSGKTALIVRGFPGTTDDNADRLPDAAVPGPALPNGSIVYSGDTTNAVIYWGDNANNPVDNATQAVASTGSQVRLGYLTGTLFNPDNTFWRVNGAPRFNLIESLTFAAAGQNAVTITIVASATPTTEAATSATLPTQRSRITLVRTVSTTRGL